MKLSKRIKEYNFNAERRVVTKREQTEWNTRIEARMAMIKDIVIEDKKHPFVCERLRCLNGYVVGYGVENHEEHKILVKYLIH